MHQKHKEQFINPGNRYTQLNKAPVVYHRFDQFVLKEKSVVALELIADKLIHFKQHNGTLFDINSFVRLLET